MSVVTTLVTVSNGNCNDATTSSTTGFTTTAVTTTISSSSTGNSNCIAGIVSSTESNGNQPQRKGHRRQESLYAVTGLYSEAVPEAEENVSDCNDAVDTTAFTAQNLIIKCHSRNASAVTFEVNKEKNVNTETPPVIFKNVKESFKYIKCRLVCTRKYSGIKSFVFLLSFLVTLQQALSSGYINSVITTIEKRFEIPSSLSGVIASSYEIGNVITVIFVSYLGSRRHIPVWIGFGAIIMGFGSFIFIVPHFIADEYVEHISINNNSHSENMCRTISVREDDMGLGRLSSRLTSSNNPRRDNCIQGTPSTTGPVLIFVFAQLLLGCGGSPLFTLGTTYIDDHVKSESSSIFIGCMYSMAAFGPVLGFLLGGYLLSFHMDSFSKIIAFDARNSRWIGMWWGGFMLVGCLLWLIAVPFFSFPKVLVNSEKNKVRSNSTKTNRNGTNNNTSITTNNAITIANNNSSQHQQQCSQTNDLKYASDYGKDIKDIPKSMWRLVSNKVYIVTCLGACMELIIVSGFVVFLPKYLETQFSLGKSQASVFTGSVAIPGACIGIFMGGCILKRMELRPKGAIQFILISNVICLACYALLFFLGCDNLKMAGTTIPYTTSQQNINIKQLPNSPLHSSNIAVDSNIVNKQLTMKPFQVNLTSSCNFGCECRLNDVEPVCGNNGVTYFSPCHAGCTSTFRSNYVDCACIHSNVQSNRTSAITSKDHDYAEVTVVPVASAGPCRSSCHTIYPFLVLLFVMAFVVAISQMPLLMIVLRSVQEEERSFALGMQFVIFRVFGYIPAPILFGNLIDSTCLLWKNACGENSGRCILYDIEQFRYRYVGLCAAIKIIALCIFLLDWWLVKNRKELGQVCGGITNSDIAGSIISLDKLFEENTLHETRHRRNLSGISVYDYRPPLNQFDNNSSTQKTDTCAAFTAESNENRDCI